MSQSVLKPQHQEFLIHQVATFAEMKHRCLAAQLASAKIAAENDFRPVKVSHTAVGKFLRKPENKARVEGIRRQWSNDIHSVRLGNKVARLIELANIYDSVDTMKRADGKEYSPMARAELKQQILRHIREEVGEDVERLADALRSGGADIHVGDVINNVWRILTPEERAEAKRDVADCLAPGSGRNRLSDITG